MLSTGSGEGDGVSFANSELSAQVFSPPYLFNPDGSLAARPTIASAPTTVSYGGSISVESPEAATVARGTLIRLGSATHSFNMSQVIYPLSFSAAGTTLTGSTPAGPEARAARPVHAVSPERQGRSLQGTHGHGRPLKPSRSTHLTTA